MSLHRRGDGIFALTVGRPVALSVLFCTLIVVGAIAYRRIPVQLLPSDFSEPEVSLWVPNRGASAQENEEQVARIVEEQLRTLTGIEEVRSYSDEDDVYIRIVFDGNVDMDLAKAEVRDRLERARPQLPDTAGEPQTWTESSSSLPITFFGILLRGDMETRDRLMEKVVVPRLEAVQGIGKVTVWGVLQDSVRILLDEDEVVAARMDIGAVIRRLTADNFAMPLGELEDGGREFLLRSDMRFRSLEEIEDYPVGNGLRVKDVGRVVKVKSVGDSLSHIDGGTAYYGMASKDSQSNVVEVSRNWTEALEELESDPALEGRMSSIVFFLQGEMIESALGQLRQTAVWGGLLAVLVLFVFLRRVRLTLCVALSIPVSALLAIAWEYFGGGTFNVLTMTGITLGIGMLVDNAVVVVENIARLHQEGEPPKRAAIFGTHQIALAVTLATLTTVVVFLPLIFMTEDPIVRILFGGLGIPLSVSLLASLLVAVVFLPVITARLLGARHRRVGRLRAAAGRLAEMPVRGVAWLVGGLRLAFHGGLRAAFHVERALLRVLTPLRWPLALAAIALLVLQVLRSAGLEGTRRELADLGVEPEGAGGPAPFAVAALAVAALALVGLPRWRRRPRRPPARPARFVPEGRSLIGMVISLNQALVGRTLRHRVAGSALAGFCFLSIAIPASNMEVTPFGEEERTDYVEFDVLFNAQFTLSEAAEEVAVYEEYLESLRDELGYEHWTSRFDERDADMALYWEQRQDAELLEAVEERLRQELPRVPGHTLVFYDDESSSERSQSVARFTLTGPDATELEHLGERARRILAEVPGLSQVKTPGASAPPQINVRVDTTLANDLGVTTDAIQQTISWTLRGFPLPRYQEAGREVPFLIEFDEEQIAGLSTLRDLGVFAEGSSVPLSSVANLEFGEGSRRIVRRNGRTSYTLTAEVGDPMQVIPITEAGYRALAQELDLPRGYSIDRTDSARNRQEQEFAELKNALLLSIVLVFLLMGILFESLLLPFSVLFTIPFAAMGAMWTLWITGTPMDSMGWIGLIILSGVVVNNGIVLIDRIHSLRDETEGRDAAVLAGCAQRVRPVLMTALTTVCGLLPMILSTPPSNGFDYRALATIVAGGLVASTFFTLWVVPLAYTLLDDLARAVRETLRNWRAHAVRLVPAPASASGPEEPGGSSAPRR